MATQFFKAGGLATDTMTDLIVLWGNISTSGNVSHFRKVFTTAGYQTTAGKTLYVAKMRLNSSGNNSAVYAVKLGYADNDVGLDTATARTNPVMAFGVDDTNANGLIWNASIEFGVTGSPPHGERFGIQDPFPISIASKYPFARLVSDGVARSIFLWCFEL